MSELPYRPNVCMLVYNRDFQILIGERLGSKTWQLPQGGAKKKWSLEENVYRELQEELGLKRRHIGRMLQLQATHRYLWGERTPKHWAGKFCGQCQTFWAVQFLGRDQDIDLEADDHPEFSAWAWCAPERLLETVEPIRRAGYEAPLQEFVARVIGAPESPSATAR